MSGRIAKLKPETHVCRMKVMWCRAHAQGRHFHHGRGVESGSGQGGHHPFFGMNENKCVFANTLKGFGSDVLGSDLGCPYNGVAYLKPVSFYL